MPETSMKTHALNVIAHMQKARSLLELNPQRLTNIQVHMGLTRQQTLAILERLEGAGEIYCRAGVWRLTDTK